MAAPSARRVRARFGFLATETAMMPLEFYWPADMLARAFPDRFRRPSGSQPDRHRAALERLPTSTEYKAVVAYTSERLAGGCVVYRLGERTQV